MLQAQEQTDALIPYLDGRLYGYSNWDGEIMINPDYEEASPFDAKGHAAVVKYGLHGIINKKGQEVIPHFSTKPLTQQKLYSIDQKTTVLIKGLIQYYDDSAQKGFIVRAADHSIVHEVFSLKSSSNSHGGVLSSYFGNSFPYGYKKICFADSTTNVIDTSGQILFKNNYYNIAILGTNLFAIEDRQGAVQIINDKGAIIQSTKYNEVRRVYFQPFYRTIPFEQKGYDKQVGLLDGNGKSLLPNAYPSLTHAIDDVFLTRHKNYSQYFVNSKGDSLGTTTISEVRSLSNTHFAAKENNHWILYDQTLQPVNDIRFNRLNSNSLRTIAYGSTDNETYFYMEERSEPLVVESAECGIHNYKSYQGELVINASTPRSYHLYDAKGNLLIPDAYNEIRYLGINQCYAVKQGYKRGVYDIEKGWILPLQMWWTFDYQTIDHETSKIEVIFDREGMHYLLKDNYEEVLVGPEINPQRKRTVLKDQKIDYVEDRQGKKYYWTGEGRPQLGFAGNYPYFGLRSDRNYILYSVDGKRISPEGYWQNGNCKSFMHDGVAYFELAGEKQRGVIDQDGTWVIGPVLIDGKPYTRLRIDNHGFVTLRGLKGTEYFDLKSNLLNRPNQLRIKPIHQNCIIVQEGLDRDNFKEYAYDRSMNRLVPDAITYTGFTDNGFMISTGTESILYDFEGKELNRFPVAWIETNTSHPDFWKYKKGHTFGVISKNGEILTPAVYKYITYKKPFLVLQKPDQHSDLLTMDGVLKEINIKSGTRDFIPIADNHYLSTSYDDSNVINAAGNLVSTADVKAMRIKEENSISSFCLSARKDKRTYYINMYTGKKYIKE